MNGTYKKPRRGFLKGMKFVATSFVAAFGIALTTASVALAAPNVDYNAAMPPEFTNLVNTVISGALWVALGLGVVGIVLGAWRMIKGGKGAAILFLGFFLFALGAARGGLIEPITNVVVGIFT